MRAYVDPYINRKTGILRNLQGISNRAKLQEVETLLTGLAMKELAENPIKGAFDFDHLCKIHETIFKDIYEWAGSPRIINIEKSERVLNGLSVEYAECNEIQRDASMILSKMNAVDWDKLTLDEKTVEFSKYMADLWKVHPFREGNTRTTVTFCCDFAESRGFGLDRTLFSENSAYMRNALVAASAKFYDLGDLSKPEFLRKIVKDGMERGEKIRQQERGNARSMDDYKAQISKERAVHPAVSQAENKSRSPGLAPKR